MILGTHNTMTYATPINLIGRLFSWTAKCQDKTIDEQIESGVRAVDIRIKFDKENTIIAHGLAKYSCCDIYAFIDLLIDKGITHIRIGLESLFYSSRKDRMLFMLIVFVLRTNRPNIKFVAFIKHPYKEFVHEFDYVELQHSPQILKEALIGPRRLLSLQKPIPNTDMVVFKDFI